MALNMRMPCSLLDGKPNSSTPGWVGMLVMDTTSASGDIYKCIAVNNNVTTWRIIASSGEVIDDAVIADAIADYLVRNPIDAPVTSVNGKTGTVKLTASDVGALTEETLDDAIDDALAEAKASGEFDGEDGVDGVGIREVKQTTSSTVSGGKNVVTVYLTNGSTYTFTVYNGQKGADGEGGGGGGTGEDGVSVSDAAINENGELVLYLSNGDEINVGRVVGADGQDGKDGTSVTVKSVTNNTEDGQTNTVTFSDGKTLNVKNGSKGSDGKNGTDGKTPVKGTDYWTASDKAEMVSDVLSALPTWNGGSY